MAIKVSLKSTKTNKINNVRVIITLVIKVMKGFKPLPTQFETSERIDFPKKALLRFKNQLYG